MRSPCNGAKGCPLAPTPVIRWAKDEHGKRAVLSYAKNNKLFKNHRMAIRSDIKQFIIT